MIILFSNQGLTLLAVQWIRVNETRYTQYTLFPQETLPSSRHTLCCTLFVRKLQFTLCFVQWWKLLIKNCLQARALGQGFLLPEDCFDTGGFEYVLKFGSETLRTEGHSFGMNIQNYWGRFSPPSALPMRCFLTWWCSCRWMKLGLM